MSAKSVLLISYPLLTVSDESCGGAEQMLWAAEVEMARRGYRTIVAASAGSRVTGELLATGNPCTAPDDYQRREVEHAQRILEYLRGAGRPELIHDHSGSFWQHAAGCDVPLLATLHLPRSFYPQDAFALERLRSAGTPVVFNCVSESQRREFSDLGAEVVPNGILVDRFPIRHEKDDYLLWMGRICEEKAPHVAIEVAKRCGLRLVLAGAVYPFSYHQEYFRQAVLPLVEQRGSQVHFIGPQSFYAKLWLLRRARALLITSQCAETSSLVSMEAMACGTPVIGFRRGAVPEVVADGETGFIVDDAEQMAAAAARVIKIDSRACRERVLTHFSAARMADDYERLYTQILTDKPRSVSAA